MKLNWRIGEELSSRRAQHLVYLLHVWLCVPFLFFWVTDTRIKVLLGERAIGQLRILVAVMLGYTVLRTWLAYIDPPKLKWWLVFPPIDVAIITLILCTTHRGPMSNITLLYLLPMVQASGSLNVRWSWGVGLMVVAGTALATLTSDTTLPMTAPANWREMLRDDGLNVAFRVIFLLILSSLMAYQARIAAGFQRRLGVEEDRNRIAMDMHDGVQGHLITIASQLELISRVAEKDGHRAAELATEGREGARQAADELRFLVQRLRTPALESGFLGAMRQYAHNICDRNGLTLVFEVTGPEASLGADLENALFRLTQEALTNVVKHAGASSVAVNVLTGDSMVRLSIVDDGRGFDSRGVCEGVGLEGMRKRVADNGGELCVQSKFGAGTTVEATFRIGARNG